MSTKLEMIMAFEGGGRVGGGGGLPATIFTWHNSCVTSKKSYISVFTAHDYQTRPDNGIWYWAVMHKVTCFFDHVIICSPVTNKKRYIFNSTSPMDTKLDRIVAYDMGPKLKKSRHSQ